MIIPKEEYTVSEDIVTIIYEYYDRQPMVTREYQTEYDEVKTLDDIELWVDRFNQILTVTVIAENPLSGRIMRFDKLNGNWKLLGTLKGYA